MLRSPRRTLSYAEAALEVNRIAQVLTEDLGLVPGNRVLLRGGNSIAMALAWLAVVKAGLIAVATMPLLRAKELGDIIDKAQPAVALCEGKLLDELELARAAASGAAHGRRLQPARRTRLAGRPRGRQERRLPGLPDGGRRHRPAGLHLGHHRQAQGPGAHAPRRARDVPDLAAPCAAGASDDIVIGSPPLAFTFGLGGLLIFPMWAGASVYFHDAPYTPESMVEVIREVGATICYTAPTFYRQMAPFARQHGVGELRISVSAGEALPDATRQLWKQATGIEMLDGIGGTEVFHIYISAAGDEVRRGAVGKVVPGFTAKIVDDEGHEVPRGTVGKLAIIGPVGCRYLDDPRQADYVRDGWNYPGDAFVEDEDGYFFYQSRADDMIVTAGYNVGGPEVEDALLKHPAVAECGVIGKPDEERGMIVKAFCVLKPGHTGDAATGQGAAGARQGHHRTVQIPRGKSRSWPTCRAPRPENSNDSN